MRDKSKRYDFDKSLLAPRLSALTNLWSIGERPVQNKALRQCVDVPHILKQDKYFCQVGRCIIINARAIAKKLCTDKQRQGGKRVKLLNR